MRRSALFLLCCWCNAAWAVDQTVITDPLILAVTEALEEAAEVVVALPRHHSLRSQDFSDPLIQKSLTELVNGWPSAKRDLFPGQCLELSSMNLDALNWIAAQVLVLGYPDDVVIKACHHYINSCGMIGVKDGELISIILELESSWPSTEVDAIATKLHTRCVTRYPSAENPIVTELDLPVEEIETEDEVPVQAIQPHAHVAAQPVVLEFNQFHE